MKILKMIGVAFCALVTLAGIINTVSPGPSGSRAENAILTLIFLAFAVLLIRSIRKGSPARRTTSHSSNGAPSKPLHPHRASPAPASTAAPPIPVLEQYSIATQAAQITPAVDQSALIASFKRIPDEVFRLLWFLNGPFQNYKQDFTEWDLGSIGEFIHVKSVHTCEPSAIDISLPLSLGPVSPTPLDYYPSYEALTPQQRTIYLNWLIDITVPIDIGYVFIFYYGLERHLFFGNSDAALATILTLRAFHKNRSFQAYSEDAILLYALARNKPEVLQHLSVQQLSPDSRLFASAMAWHRLTAQDVMAAHKKFSFENTRYIKSEPKLFLTTLENLLFEKLGEREFAISVDDFRSAKGTFTLALANYSMLPTQRFLPLPDISTSPRVHDSINSLLVETHESVKVKLRECRKQAKGSQNALSE